MRFISTLPNDFNTRVHRWVFMKSREGAAAQGEEADKLLSKLDSPHYLAIADIRKLDQLQGNQELTAEQKAKINGIAEFYVSLINDDFDGNMPSGMLFELRYSNLWTHVRPNVANRVNTLMSKQGQKLQSLLEKDVSSFSNNEMARFLRYYKAFHLKARRAKMTTEDESFSKKVAEKFVAHAHTLMAGFSINSTTKQLEPIVSEFDSEAAPVMKTRDKFFIMQAYRMFGRQYDWAINEGSGTASNLRQYSQAVVQELKANLADSENYAKKIEYLPLWEVIEDLVENEGASFDDLSDGEKRALSTFAGQARSAQILNWAQEWQKSGQSQLLPEHVQALAEIKSSDFGKVFGASEEELAEVIKQFIKDNGKIFVEDKDKEGKSRLTDITELIETEKSKINEVKAFEAYQKTQQEFFESGVFMSVSRGVRPSSEENKSFDFTELLNNFKSQIKEKVHRQNVSTGNSDEQKQWIENDKSWLASFSDLISSFKDTLEKQLNAPGYENNGDLKKLVEATSRFAKTPSGKDFENLRSQTEQTINKHRVKVSDSNNRIQRYRTLAENFANSSKNAEVVLDKYRGDLKSRINERRLTAADMAVLFEDSKEIVLPESEGFVDRLVQFRTDCAPIFNRISANILGEIEGTYSVSEADRLRLWTDILDKYLSYGNITSELSDLGLKDEFDSLANEKTNGIGLSTKVILDGVLSSYREDIYNTIAQKVNLSISTTGQVQSALGEGDEAVSGEKFLSDYLSKYDRLHSHLYETNTKQRTVEAGQRAYLSHRNENQILKDTVRQNLYQKLGGIDKEKFTETIRRYLLPSVQPRLNDIVNALDNKEVYFDLLSNDLMQSQLGKNLKNIIPVELHDTAITAIASEYTLWQARKHNEQILDSTGQLVMDGTPGVPGRNRLNEIKLQTVEYDGEFAVIFDDFKHDFDFWVRRMASGESIPHEEVSAFFSRVRQEFCPRLKQLSQDLRDMLTDRFPDLGEGFIGPYIHNIENAIETLLKTLNIVDETYKGGSWEKYSIQDIERIKSAFLDIGSALRLDHGAIKDVEAGIKQNFENIPNTIVYLRDYLGLFEPNGQKKAEAQFNKTRDRYGEAIEIYLRNNERIIANLKKDLKEMKPKDFQQRHGMNKEQGLKLIDDLKNTADLHQSGWERYGEKDYFKNWFEDYQNPKKQAGALADFEAWPLMQRQAKDMKKANEMDRKWLKDYKEANPGIRTKLLRRAFNGWTVKYTFSLIDLFYRVPKKVFEAFDRNEERRRERAVASLGAGIFGNSRIGKEFERIRWEEEDKRVKEFEGRYEKEDFHVWEQELYKLRRPNQKDEARALINLLIKEGYMRWDKPELWRTLMAIQRPKKVHFNIPDDLTNLSLEDIMGKVGDASAHIWTTKIFTDWDGEMEGNHKKQMESNYKNFDRMCNRAGALDAYFSDAMEKWKNNDKSVNPAEFEGFLHRAFENAKYNGQGGDKRWFYLIMGMTLKNDRGETLISHEAKDRFNKIHLKAMPFFDFFVDNACSKLNGMPVPHDTPGAHTGGWSHDDIQAWGDFMMGEVGNSFSNPDANYAASEKFMIRYMMNSPIAKLRSDRFGRAAGDAQDHDDAWIHGAGASYQNILQMLNRSSQGSDTISPDFAAQILQGYDIFMRHNTEYIREMEMKIGGTPGWEEWKKGKLIEIGLVIRKMFLVTNTIAGNYHGHSAQSPQTIDQRYWRDDPNMTNVQANRAKINEGVKSLIEIAGGSISDDILNYTGVLQVGDNYNERKENDSYKAVSAEVGKVLNNEAIFGNLDYIQKWIDKMYPG